jgi:hypothetical protein
MNTRPLVSIPREIKGFYGVVVTAEELLAVWREGKRVRTNEALDMVNDRIACSSLLMCELPK